MTNSLNRRRYPTSQGTSQRLRETGGPIARRPSRRFSSGETIRLARQPHEKSVPRDPQSYVTRPLEESVEDRAESEVLLKDLRTSDSLTIQTEYSTYTFLVIDPAERAGILTGGRLRRHMMSVILVGAVDEREPVLGRVRDEPGRLRRGAQAVFYLRSAEGMKRLTTSPITRIVHVRSPR